MGTWPKPSPADADDVGRARATWPKPRPADAHDAGRVWACGQHHVQLILMMLGGLRHVAGLGLRPDALTRPAS